MCIKYVLIGGGFAFAAAVQPGPLNAFLLSRVAADGWKRTLPAAFAPLISDIPIACLMLFLLHHVPGGFEAVLRGAGGVVLLFLAVKTFLEWRHARLGDMDASRHPTRTFLQAVGVNLVNPGPYIGWSLVLGPLALQAWSQSPLYAVALIGAFYSVIVICLASLILFIGMTSTIHPRVRLGLLLAASVVLAVLGVYFLVSIILK